MITAFLGSWEYWLLNQKIIFDGASKLIIIVDGIETINVREDLYTAWVNWIGIQDNSKYQLAFKVIGGEPTSNGQSIAPSYFLINGWRIRPWEGNYRLSINGNIYTEEGVSPFVPTLNPANIVISNTVSSIVTQVSTSGSSSDGSSATPDEIAIATKAYIQTDLNKIDALPTAIQNASAVKSILLPQLNKIDSLPLIDDIDLMMSSQKALTESQATMLLEIYNLMGLDPTKPLIVTQTDRSSGSISQTIEVDETAKVTTVTRQV